MNNVICQAHMALFTCGKQNQNQNQNLLYFKRTRSKTEFPVPFMCKNRSTS